ncbi:CPBP family intramembrane glutamic endopeptidase [Ascidiaceihabitans sp.]|uniref:CPBP family intramembrane glutamic endopeptidase n=1 Tax=Ascidiaceihabitans sp. TaxID=1872644 RepID=UPI003299F1E6
MRRDFAYRAHKSFVAPAKSHMQLWRLAFGILLVVVVFSALGQLFAGLITVAAEATGLDAGQLQMGTGETPGAILTTLFAYGLLVPSVFLVLWVLHERSGMTVFGDLRAMKGQFIIVVLALVIVNVVLEILPPWGYGADLVSNVAMSQWLVLLPLSLVAILAQTSAEEVVFRGYIQQQLGARFQSPLIWMVLPSVLFGLLHYDTASAGENAWYIALWAMLFGMAAADLTARSGTLGPAIALHFVNNVIAMLFVTLPDNWHALALYVTPFDASNTEIVRAWLWVDLGFLGVSWLTARLGLQR